MIRRGAPHAGRGSTLARASDSLVNNSTHTVSRQTQGPAPQCTRFTQHCKRYVRVNSPILGSCCLGVAQQRTGTDTRLAAPPAACNTAPTGALTSRWKIPLGCAHNSSLRPPCRNCGAAGFWHTRPGTPCAGTDKPGAHAVAPCVVRSPTVTPTQRCAAWGEHIPIAFT